jgi:hypothetical protein
VLINEKEAHMDILDQIAFSIRNAAEKFENCPICGSPVNPEPASADADGTCCYTHDCECLIEIDMVRFEYDHDNFFFDDYIESEVIDNGVMTSGECNIPAFYQYAVRKAYTNFCHKCKAEDGIDSNLPECTRDGDYLFRCKYCQHSLRTHPLLGQGKIFDIGDPSKKRRR